MDLDVTCLPYNKAVLAVIEAEKAKGGRLSSPPPATSATPGASPSTCRFDRVLGTEDVNLSSRRKAERLIADYGDKGFDYMGNSSVDLPVWKHSRKAWVVNASKAVVRLAEGQGNVERVIDTRGNVLLTWAKALRFHQWMKNLLVCAAAGGPSGRPPRSGAEGHLHLRLRPVRVQRVCAERSAGPAQVLQWC